ncbi:MAG: hypothetical protein AAF387_05750 [Pseudomonadota bacterium]
MIGKSIKPSFIEGAVLALILSALGSLSYSLLSFFFVSTSAGLMIAGVVCALYVFYLLRRSTRKSGKLVSAVATLAILLVAMLVPVSIIALAAALLFLIWLLRSCYFRTGAFDSAGDLALIIGGAGLAIFTAMYTSSLFLSLWSFFLVQAFHVFLPAITRSHTKNNRHDDPFERAHANAESALRSIYQAKTI